MKNAGASSSKEAYESSKEAPEDESSKEAPEEDLIAELSLLEAAAGGPAASSSLDLSSLD